MSQKRWPQDHRLRNSQSSAAPDTAGKAWLHKPWLIPTGGWGGESRVAVRAQGRGSGAGDPAVPGHAVPEGRDFPPLTPGPQIIPKEQPLDPGLWLEEFQEN